MCDDLMCDLGSPWKRLFDGEDETIEIKRQKVSSSQQQPQSEEECMDVDHIPTQEENEIAVNESILLSEEEIIAMKEKILSASEQKMSEAGADEIILREEEIIRREKKKIVYFFMIEVGNPNYKLNLYSFDPHNIDNFQYTDMTSHFRTNPPPDFNNIRYHGIAALEPKLYFIGGVFFPNKTMTNKVFAFDTASNSWDTATPVAHMKFTRTFSEILTCANKIYVFGWGSGPYRPVDGFYDTSPQHWAEFYDPETNIWDFLPGTVPPQLLKLTNPPATHAVLEEQQIILLSISFRDVHAYSIKGQCWFSVSSANLFCHNPIPGWQGAIAVVKSKLYWPFCGKVFCYDLEPDTPEASPQNAIQQSLLSSCRSPFPLIYFHKSRSDFYFRPRYIVNAGNRNLCLVAECHDNLRDEHMVFQTYELQCSNSEKQLIPVYQGEVYINTRDIPLAFVAM